jgi:hypothetical protein
LWGRVRIYTKSGTIVIHYNDDLTDEVLLGRLDGISVTVEIRDRPRHAAFVCIPPNTWQSYLNSKLIRQAAWLRYSAPLDTRTPWAKVERIITSNAHVVGAGLRIYDGFRFRCADIFIKTETRVIGQHLFAKPCQGGSHWIETKKQVFHDKWPLCVGWGCGHCKRHYRGPHRATFGVEWIRDNAKCFGEEYHIDY